MEAQAAELQTMTEMSNAVGSDSERSEANADAKLLRCSIELSVFTHTVPFSDVTTLLKVKYSSKNSCGSPGLTFVDGWRDICR